MNLLLKLVDLWIYIKDCIFLLRVYWFFICYKQDVLQVRTTIENKTYNITSTVEAFYRFNRVLSCYKLITWVKYWNKLSIKKVMIISDNDVCQINLIHDSYLKTPLKTSGEWLDIPDCDLGQLRYDSE